MNQDLFVVAVINIVIGIIVLLAGYKLNKALISLCGFIFGYQLLESIVSNMDLTNGIVIALSIVGGIIFATFSFKLYLFGIFIAIFLAVFSICEMTIAIDNLKFIISIVVGIIAGILGIKFTKPIFIIMTSLSGGFLIVNYLLQLFNLNSRIVFFIFGIVISMIGMKVQFNTNKN